MIDIVLFGFAIIGVFEVGYYMCLLIHDLAYIMIFILGYLLLHLLNYNWQKVKKRPFYAFKETLKVIKFGFLDSLDTPTELRLGKWRWRPLFKYTRMV